jgi:hypothetical protein
MNVPEVLKEIVFTLLPNSVSENHGLFLPPGSLMTFKDFRGPLEYSNRWIVECDP